MLTNAYSSRLHKLVIVCFLLFTFFPVTLFASPKTTLQLFYENINKKQCEAAVELRENYSEERCLQVSEVIIHETDIAFNNGLESVMLISIDIYTENAKSYFSGYVRLRKKDSYWKIIGPYKSRESYTLGEYVNDYLPDVEVPAVNDASDERPTIEQTNNNIATEIQKYLSGEQAIAGNYTSLLNDLRAQLPKLSQEQIILIDRSRLSLYLYDQNNLLLSFFPILSLSIEQIPNGLFTTVNTSETVNNENTPVHLNHLRSLDESINNDESSYYIRDLLDSDSSRSLILSPIDLGKLHKLLSSNTFTYLGD